MDYQQFRAWRDRVVAESQPLRLDCMNPAKALASLTPSTLTLSASTPPGATTSPVAGAASAGEALRAWQDRFAVECDADCALVTSGARPALGLIFSRLKAQGYDLWLPEDVYPEYWNLADEVGLCRHPFVTLPTPHFGPLDNMPATAALLLPQPLMPLGRYLSIDEVEVVRSLLLQNPRRRLILDAVYHFDNRLDPATRSLWQAGQTYVVHSLAKSWLLPNTLGVVLTPPGEAESMPTEPLADDIAGRAIEALRRFPAMPQQVEAVLRRQWGALTDRIRAAVPGWEPPSTGYFSLVAAPFEYLLQRHDILAVPASVFGSRREDLSVISCLYYPA